MATNPLESAARGGLATANPLESAAGRYKLALLQFLQGASNETAGTVSAPVDGIAWGLRKMGIDLSMPVGGSDWMAARGLTKPVPQNASSVAGQTAGLLSPVAAAAKAPKIAAGLLQAGENMQKSASLSKQRGALVWHGPNKKNDMTLPELADLVSSQRYLDRDRVAQKIKEGDFVVKVTPPFEIEGEKVRAITDGHHALQAAIRSGNKPRFVQQTATTDDRVALLKAGKIDEYLQTAYQDAPWYRYSTGVDIW
jgi:hypothetical protein